MISNSENMAVSERGDQKMATFLLLNRGILRFPSSSSTPEEILRLFREHLETKFWTNMLLKGKIGGKSFGIYSIKASLDCEPWTSAILQFANQVHQES